MSDHTTNRLTAQDNARIDDAVAAYAADSTQVIQSERFTTAERIAHHAIGCTARDLRDTELDAIAELVQRHLGPPT